MEHDVNTLTTFAHMLSMTLGSLIQITLSDHHSYLFVEHAIDKETFVGGEISENEKYFLSDEEFRKLPFVVNYKSLSHNMNRLRSSTYFYKDKKGNIEYILTLTANVDEFMHVRDVMDIFTNGIRTSATTNFPEEAMPKLNMSVQDLIDNVISEGQKRYNTVVERMTKMEKQSLIREMHSRGAFLIKGAVTEAAAKLNYSETTVYRYLQKLEGK